MKNRTKELLDSILKVSALLSLLLIIPVGVLFVIIPDDNPYCRFIKSVLPNFVPILITFSVSVLILKKIISIKNEVEQEELIDKICHKIVKDLPKSENDSHSSIYQEFDQIGFKALIEPAGKIEIVVHYFDSWLNRHRQSFKIFFNNGGNLHLILPNPENQNLLKLIHQRIPEYDIELLRTKITDTYERLKSWSDKSTHKKSSVEVSYTDKLINYCAVKFDNDYSVISVFSHTREERTVEAPAFLIDVKSNQKINEWLLAEINYLM